MTEIVVITSNNDGHAENMKAENRDHGALYQ